MGRPSLRLATLAIIFGVGMGILYSLTLGVRRPHPDLHSLKHRHRHGHRRHHRRSHMAAQETALESKKLSVDSASKEDAPQGTTSAVGEASSTVFLSSVTGAEQARADGGEVSANEPLPRVCGSPAVDGYAHVDPKCLEDSPTNKLWWKMHPDGGKSGEGLECNVEHSVSLDGLAVWWGIGHKKNTPEECCQACRDHVPGPQVGGPFGNLPCNVWVYCNAPVCYEADAHSHSQGDCWLKFSEAPQSPEVNARGDFPPDFRQRHPDAPERCQWVSGVLVPPGQKLTNGTWGPRYKW